MKFILQILFLITLSSCSSVPNSQDTEIEQYNLNENFISSYEYFLDNDLVKAQKNLVGFFSQFGLIFDESDNLQIKRNILTVNSTSEKHRVLDKLIKDLSVLVFHLGSQSGPLVEISEEKDIYRPNINEK